MRGLSVAIIFINHTEASARSIPDAWRGSSVTRIVLNKSLSFPAEFALHKRAAQESQRLTTLRKSLMPALLRRIVARSAAEALESSTLTNMRIASQIRTLIAHLRPKVVVSTHEGHAFERVAFAAARESMPEVCCVAHQHSALFRLQHSIRRNLSAPYNPDFILASGVISQSQLKNAPELRHIPIMVFGSARISAIANYFPLLQPVANRLGWKLTILPRLQGSRILFLHGKTIASLRMAGIDILTLIGPPHPS